MKKLALATLPLAIMMATQTYAVESKKDNPITPKIVGGEVAQEQQWPWMSALVYTFNDVDTSLVVDGVSFESNAFTSSPSGNASGELMDCGIGDSACADATDKVCLIERGEINFSEKALNCEAGGGVGVVIYNNVDGRLGGTLGDGFSGSIPVVAVTQASGNTLKGMIGSTASVEVASSQELLQDSTCGASFLGDRWVLTASHCVDDANPNILKVNVGEYDLSDGANLASSIRRIYMHPYYNTSTLNNDVALIELEESVNAEAVTLASKETTNTFAQDNSIATVIGWGGRVGYGPGQGPTSDFPDVLHQVDINLMTNEQCIETLQNSTGGNFSSSGITPQMLCATFEGGGRSSCQGDSGGPLVVNTNEGWQQVGVVSWGIGCAAEGYPGVFARAAEFTDWLENLYQGIAIDQTIDFNVVATDQSFTNSVTVVNNSPETATLTFEVQGNDELILDASDCEQVGAGQSCQVSVTSSLTSVSDVDTELKITAANTEVKTSSARILAKAIAPSNDVSTVMATPDISWYSGGDLPWQENATDSGIESGSITHSQDSIVMAVINGVGTLSFDWKVSSEENVDDPSSPYDALYLYVNGVENRFISGEVGFANVQVQLTEELNRVTWIYRKDPSASSGDDKAYLRNVRHVVSNEAPVISNITADQSVNEGANVSLSVTATDADNDTLTYSWTASSSDITLTGADTASVSFVAPQVTANTDYTIEVVVSDGVEQVTRSSVVTVRNVVAPTPTPTPAPSGGSSGGGSMAWLSLMLLGLLRFRK